MQFKMSPGHFCGWTKAPLGCILSGSLFPNGIYKIFIHALAPEA
jgi:hypothetical protein